MKDADFARLRLRRPKAPLGTFHLPAASKPATDAGSVAADPVPPGPIPTPDPVGPPVAPAFPPSSPAVVRGAREALFETIARIERATEFGRMLPHLDEAYAALFGASTWAAYLDWSGSGALADAGSEPGLSSRLFDLVPAMPRCRFDPLSGRLVVARPGPRPPPRAALLEGMVGPFQSEVFEVMAGAACAPLAPGLLLADPGFDWSELPDWAVWRFEGSMPIAGSSVLLEVEGSDRPYCSGLARLVGAAAFAPASGVSYEGDVVADPGEELFLSLVESAGLARAAAAGFEHLRFEAGYKLDEPVGERLSTFAGAQLADFALLAAARLPGFADVLRRAERDGPNSADWPKRVLHEKRVREAGALREEAGGGVEGVDADAGAEAGVPPAPSRPELSSVLANLVLPNRVPFDAAWRWFVRPHLGIDALNAAFFALQGVAPRSLADHRPCDLAAGFAHLRQMAYAMVAIDAKRHGLSPDRTEEAARAELEFWLAGVGGGSDGRPRCHGLAPIMGSGAFSLQPLAAEPPDLMKAIAAARADAGLASPDIDLAVEMRARQGLRSLPAFVREVDDEGIERARAFRQRRAARILAERAAAGIRPPDREPDPDGMPELGGEYDEEVLRLVPAEDCAPKLRPHPNPRAAFQLEEPAFVTRARLERERQAAEGGDLVPPDEAGTAAG